MFCVKSRIMEDPSSQIKEGKISTFIRVFYSSIVLCRSIQPFIVVGFIGWTFANLSPIMETEIGLNQELTIPKDSYLQKYFKVRQGFVSINSI